VASLKRTTLASDCCERCSYRCMD